MKCLSLWNPWAVLLVGGAKKIETRGWPIRHRGPLLIHAAKWWSRDLFELCRAEPFRSALEGLGHPVALPEKHGGTFRPRGLPFGAVVGRVDVVDCVPTERVRDLDDPAGWPQWAGGCYHVGPAERAFGDYGPGRFAFLCAVPVRFEKPVPCRGMQGLFDVPDDLVKEERPS